MSRFLVDINNSSHESLRNYSALCLINKYTCRDAPIPILDLELAGIGFAKIRIEALIYADNCKFYSSTTTDFVLPGFPAISASLSE
jgi:hypothetical protein